MRAIRLGDSNQSGMEKLYYYSRITKQYIDKTISDIDYIVVLTDFHSTADLWNMSDDESDK